MNKRQTVHILSNTSTILISTVFHMRATLNAIYIFRCFFSTVWYNLYCVGVPDCLPRQAKLILKWPDACRCQYAVLLFLLPSGCLHTLSHWYHRLVTYIYICERPSLVHCGSVLIFGGPRFGPQLCHTTYVKNGTISLPCQALHIKRPLWAFHSYSCIKIDRCYLIYKIKKN